MPVTIRPSPHGAREWTDTCAVTATSLLKESCPKEYGRCKAIIQSSFHGIGSASISPSTNGFVRAAYAAYSSHHHLTIRPEDVWFSILTQLSFHIIANAEELRSFFVAHEGQKEIQVVQAGTLRTVHFGQLAVRMTQLMEKHIVQPDLRAWIMPDFSTTTDTDKVTAAVIMMGSMQKYFSYSMQLCCGIPSVTLLGEREDWEEIRRRLEFLPQLGEAPSIFASLLVPVLDHFINSFSDPKADDVISFWSKIAHFNSMGSGPSFLSGWLTAFCFWDADGKCLYRKGGEGLDMDGKRYSWVDFDEIPEGYVSVPVTVNDNGTIYNTRMVAGSVGIQVSRSGQMLDLNARNNENLEERTGLDSVQPVSGWWMYELTDENSEEDPNAYAHPTNIDMDGEEGILRWLDESKRLQEEKRKREQKKLELLEEGEKIGHSIIRMGEISVTT